MYAMQIQENTILHNCMVQVFSKDREAHMHIKSFFHMISMYLFLTWVVIRFGAISSTIKKER